MGGSLETSRPAFEGNGCGCDDNCFACVIKSSPHSAAPHKQAPSITTHLCNRLELCCVDYCGASAPCASTSAGTNRPRCGARGPHARPGGDRGGQTTNTHARDAHVQQRPQVRVAVAVVEVGEDGAEAVLVVGSQPSLGTTAAQQHNSTTAQQHTTRQAQTVNDTAWMATKSEETLLAYIPAPGSPTLPRDGKNADKKRTRQHPIQCTHTATDTEH